MKFDFLPKKKHVGSHVVNPGLSLWCLKVPNPFLGLWGGFWPWKKEMVPNSEVNIITGMINITWYF